jgi:outer membrane protein assembly factor BamA
MKFPRVILLLVFAPLALHAETRVRVSGLQHKGEAQVLELMGGRLTHVKASPPSAPLADDAAFILRQILRKDGFADARVDWKISAGDEITLIVREGGRLALGNVQVRGVPDEDAKRYARLFAKPAEKDRPLGLRQPPFREEDVETGLSYLRQDLNAQGHWAAEAAVENRETDTAAGLVNLTIGVKPGPVYQIGAPRFASRNDEGGSLAESAARPFAGRTANTKNLNAMRVAVEEAIVSRGYPDAGIRIGRSLEGARFIPLIDVELGERVRLRGLHVEGLKRTREERIMQRLRGMQDDWYDQAAMNRHLREFLATGAFQSARVETSPAGENQIDATLHFEEARAKEISLAAGAGSYQGFITRFTYTDRNLFGRLWGLNSGFELGSRGLLGDVRVTDPWLLGHDLSATARAYALIYGREGYDVYESGLEGRLGWKLGKNYALDFLLGNSLVSLDEDGLPAAELGEKNYNHSRLRLTQTLDFRDNPVLPTRGWHLESPLQLGAAVGDVSTSYLMAGLSGGWFHALNRRYQLGIGGEWAMLMPSGDGGDLPIDLRLFNGGARSVRSFPERELGPAANGFPTGGEAMWSANAELTRTLAGSLKAVAFFDAGTLARDYADIGSAEIELATGLGLRFELPIGPVRFEYGYNLTRDSGEPNGTFHFAIGHAY